MLDKTREKDLNTTLSETLSAFVERSGSIDERTARSLDRELRSIIAGATRGLSPVAILSAYVDWLGHLGVSPGKLLLLQQSLVKKSIALGLFNLASFLGSDVQPPVAALERRMQSDEWQRWPFNVFAQAYELSKEWATECTADIPGVSEQSTGMVSLIS